MTGKHIVILGAGASYTSGYPLGLELGHVLSAVTIEDRDQLPTLRELGLLEFVYFYQQGLRLALCPHLAKSLFTHLAVLSTHHDNLSLFTSQEPPGGAEETKGLPSRSPEY